jgi:hypothetical protein
VALGALSVLPAAKPPSPGPETEVRDLEKQIAARPAREAFAIARRGADQLAEHPELMKRLFQAAAGRQRKELSLLTKDQVVELADVYARTLGDQKAADQVRRQWLGQRERGLGQGDARARVELARLILEWGEDRTWAARLCREAYRMDPESGAAEVLRDQLEYQLNDDEWVQRPRPEKPHQPGRKEVERGMSPRRVRELLGEPKRVARQILYKRHLEQWIYDGPTVVIVEFDCTKGRDPHVLNVLEPISAKP